MSFYIELITLAALGMAVGCVVVLRQQNNALSQQNAQLKQRLNAIKQELFNAKTAKEIDKNNHALSADDVDNFLQDGGYFRSQ